MFVVVNASCIRIGVYFSSLGEIFNVAETFSMPLEWKFSTAMPMSLQYDILEFQNYLIFLLILSLSFFECPLLQLIFKLWNYFSVIYSIVECFYGAFYLIYYIFNFHRFHLAFLQSLLNSSFISFIYFLILFGYFLDACMFKCVLLGLTKIDFQNLICLDLFLLLIFYFFG